MKTTALCLVFFMVISVIPDLCYSQYVCSERFCQNGNWNQCRCFGCCVGKGYWGGWCFPFGPFGGFCFCFKPGEITPQKNSAGISKNPRRKDAEPEDGTKE